MREASTAVRQHEEIAMQIWPLPHVHLLRSITTTTTLTVVHFPVDDPWLQIAESAEQPSQQATHNPAYWWRMALEES